jgi:bifunctional NMN adenylyltransferase/nudix hydrolase
MPDGESHRHQHDPREGSLLLNTESVMHEFGVVIGRFQPFHNAHLELVRFAFKEVQKLVIVIGSANAARDTMNPWSSVERSHMIRRCLTADENGRVEFVHAKDYQSNNMWLAAVQSAIDKITGGSCDVKLIGHRKDASSFYLKLFPQWGDYIESSISLDLNATKVREHLFRQDKITIKTEVPTEVYEYLCTWMTTPEFDRLHGEYHDIENEHAAWADAPYKPTFVTTDAIVICSGHVLTVKRGGKYGKGLLAWPGGYIKVSEYVIDSCIRELKEETGIKVPAEELKKYIKDKDVFDAPRRDLRGRVITHAFCFVLPDGPLPRVKGMDDAEDAGWITIHEFHCRELEFFADHYKMGCRFVDKF